MKKLISLFLITVTTLSLKAQNEDPVLLNIGGKDVTLSEFNAIYHKNNNSEKATEESINEYLDLYIKFKLKVREAEELGYDTLQKFEKELAGYRNQLAQPYLTDKNVTEALIKEAYDRMKSEVKASHILISLDPEAYDKDTVAAYEKIMAARKRILNGESFEKVAKEVSEDPSAVKNGGDLGYFSALHMVYPFETAAYTTKVGEVSKPIRTRFGYHIVKVVDKRAARGTIKTAHIMVKASKNDTTEEAINAKKKIEEIYDKLIKENQDFAYLANQFSQDPGSARRGGELPAFTTGRMVEEFEDAAFTLKSDGDISKPFQTEFGWHIVKRISYESLASYEDIYNTVKAKVSRDSRSNKSKEALLSKIKTDNNFKENIAERNDFYKIVTKEELINGNFDIAKAKKLNKLMFGFYAPDGDKVEFTQKDFAELLASRKPKSSKINPDNLNVNGEINRLYNKQLETIAINFKDDRLPKTNQEFKLLMQEYRDGILLFDLTDKKVWSKAVKDTTGLKEFYNKNKTNYMWGERVEATVYSCNNDETAKKVSKILNSKKSYTNEEILKLVNTDSQLNLTIEQGKFSKNDNENIAKSTWKVGETTVVKNDKSTVIVIIEKLLPVAPKELNEVRGLVTSDYQNYLENEWVAELKAKYKVIVNKEVLKLVK